MNKLEYNKFVKRYDKFKNNNLPTRFWDEERQTLEYIYFSKNNLEEIELNVNNSLTDSLGDIVRVGFYYPFTARYLIQKKENNKYIFQTVVGHNHAHSFEEVVKYLYNSPESFAINDDEEKFYSYQEINYLKIVQNYLLLIGMKDLKTEKVPISRYRNKIHHKYEYAYIYKYSDDILRNILNGKVNFKVSNWYSEYDGNKKYNPKEYQALIVDENNNFKLFVEFTHRDLKTYKDIKKFYVKQELNDDDKVIATYFKIIERF
jgi:uncharacterized protein YhfF